MTKNVQPSQSKWWMMIMFTTKQLSLKDSVLPIQSDQRETSWERKVKNAKHKRFEWAEFQESNPKNSLNCICTSNNSLSDTDHMSWMITSLSQTCSPVTRQILANFLLVVPQQPVQGQNIAITNEGQAVVERVTRRAIRGDVQEKSRRKPKV